MVINHEKKFIFICNGKTGTTSIEKILQQYNELHSINNGSPGLWANKHMPPAVAKALLPEAVWNEYFKFVFVRNPYDWCLSAWRFLFSERQAFTEEFLNRPRNLKVIVARRKRDHKLRQVRCLGVQEVDLLYQEMATFRCFPHLQSCFQYYYVHDLQHRKIVDFVGRFEHLNEDFKKISDHIAIQAELPHVNQTSKTTASGYTDAGRKRVRELWALDFEGLGYGEILGK